jgi:hypothetical protein
LTLYGLKSSVAAFEGNMRSFLLVIGILVFSQITFAEKINLNLNDISVLLPLPEKDQWAVLLQPEQEGSNGLLLPRPYVVEHMPTLLQFTENAKLYPDLRVVGFRIDPCFAEGRGPLKCKQQIRFVWQPLKIVDEKTLTVDVALHSFYELNDNDFKNLIQQLKDLKRSYSDLDLTAQQPLSVHPIIKLQGLDGDYYQSLQKIILSYVGQKNLIRITFMQLFANETVWFFGGLEIQQDGSFKKITIPRINLTLQQFINSAPPARASTSFLGRIFPVPPQKEDNVNILLSDSRLLDSKSENEIIESVRSAYRIENPNLHNPGTLDCVSCHAAQPARIWAETHFANFNYGDLSKTIYKPSPTNQNLTNVSPLKNLTNIVRIFGYFDQHPIVTNRAINETNEAVYAIQNNYE